MTSQPCFPMLDGLPIERLEGIMKNLDNDSKKSLRLVNQYFLAMSRRLEKTFLKILMFSEISADSLILMSDQVQTVKGIEIGLLYGNRVDASIRYLLIHHPELESFKVNSSHCSDKSLNALLFHPNIRTIQLPSCGRITGENISKEPDSEAKLSLKVLDLSWCHKLTDIGLVGLLNLTDGECLTELNLSSTFITFDNIGDLTTSFHNLKQLRLDSCFSITEAGAISLLNRVGGELTWLSLPYTKLTLDNLTTSLTKLEQLNLCDCPNVTDTGVVKLLNRVGGELRHLNLLYSNITLDKIRDLTASFPKLEQLRLSCCPNITEAGLISLLHRVGDGAQVYIGETPASAANIRDQFPSLTVIDSETD